MGKAEAAGKQSITLDSSASNKDGHYKGWVVEVCGGKGIGQPPVVVRSYDGTKREATLGMPWDASIATPDGTTQYTLCKQLQLRRVIKAFLHPDFAYTGGGVGSEKEANRLKVVQHTLMLVRTIWNSVPEERGSVVQGFCDQDCLVFGLESPDDAEVCNATSRWRTYTVRMHAPGGKKISTGVFAAPGDALIQQGRKGVGSTSGKKLSLKQPDDESKALGWLRQEVVGRESPPGFWHALCRWVLGAPDGCSGGEFLVDEEGRTSVRCKMPKALHRQPIALLDGNKMASALIRVLSSPDMLARIMSMRAFVRGRFAREALDAIADVASDKDACVERVRAELRLADWCMQDLETQGYDKSEAADAALSKMWERLEHKMLFTDMDGERERALRAVPLPYALRNFIYASVVSAGKSSGNEEKQIISLFESPQGPLADAVDSLCRRMHIESCAVNIIAIHLEQQDIGATSGGATRGQEAKVMLLRDHICVHALTMCLSFPS